MKFKLVADPSIIMLGGSPLAHRLASCSTLDHIYPTARPGHPCYCGRRTWGEVGDFWTKRKTLIIRTKKILPPPKQLLIRVRR